MSWTPAPAYFNAISTPEALKRATDSHYEYAGTLAAAITAVSKDPETTKTVIWKSVNEMASHGVTAEDIIGTLATTLALFTIEILNPAVDLLEEMHPGLDYRAAVGRAITPDTNSTQEPR
jgi:hypothetical protein